MTHSETFRRPSWRILATRWLCALGMLGSVTVTPSLLNAQCRIPVRMPNSSWSGQIPGPPGHIFETHEEREFKYGFRGTGVNDSAVQELPDKILNILRAASQDNFLWAAPRVLDPNNPAQYTFKKDTPDEDGFLDVYFDTQDNVNYRSNVIYRFRQRFGTIPDLDLYLTGKGAADDVEIQSKVNRRFVSPGLSVSTENRARELEGKFPFPVNELPVALCEAQLGTFDGDVTIAAFCLVAFLQDPTKTNQTVCDDKQSLTNQQFSFFPKLILRVERARLHLQIPIAISGDPITQVFLITVDTATVFESESLLAFLRGDTSSPPLGKGSFTEVEVELENDTADLDLASELRAAFLLDQQQVLAQIAAKINADTPSSLTALLPENRTKYNQAFEILFNRTLNITSTSSAINIAVSPNDNNGHGNGVTPLTRVYVDNTVVTLRAPVTAGATNFQMWRKDGAESSRSLRTQVRMDADHGMTAVYAPPSNIRVTFPNGNNIFLIGTTRNILWSSSDLIGNVRIEISRNNGAGWTTIFSSVTNDGNQNWRVTGPATTQARVRICRTSDPSICDISDANFIIR